MLLPILTFGPTKVFLPELIFEKITMMQSFSYNIWKGNHPYAMKNSLVAGAEIVDEDFQKQLKIISNRDSIKAPGPTETRTP